MLYLCYIAYAVSMAQNHNIDRPSLGIIMVIMLKYTKICTLLLIEPVALSVKSIGGGACFILKHYWEDFAFLFSMWMGFSISERNLKGEATVIVYSLIKQHSHYSIIVRVVILLN